MRRVDEARKPLGAAVRSVGSKGVEAVVAPAALAREGGHGHQLDRGHAELAERGQTGDDGVEGALVGERADVHLVEHELVELEAAAADVGPPKGSMVDDGRGSAYAVGLMRRARIGIRLRAVEREEVLGAGGAGEASAIQPVLAPLEVVRAVRSVHGERAGMRRPDGQLDAAVALRDRAQAASDPISGRRRNPASPADSPPPSGGRRPHGRPR